MDKTLQAKRGRKTEDEEGRKGGWEEGVGEGRRESSYLLVRKGEGGIAEIVRKQWRVSCLGRMGKSFHSRDRKAGSSRQRTQCKLMCRRS